MQKLRTLSSQKDIVNMVYCMWVIPIFDNKETDRGIKFSIIAAINSRIISICLRTEENNGRYNRLKLRFCCCLCCHSDATQRKNMVWLANKFYDFL